MMTNKTRLIAEWIEEMEKQIEEHNAMMASMDFMPPPPMHDKRNSLYGKLAYLETLQGFGRKYANTDTFAEWDKDEDDDTGRGLTEC